MWFSKLCNRYKGQESHRHIACSTQVAYLTLKLQNNHFQHSKSSFPHFLHFHTHLTFTNTYILIILTKQYHTLTHSTFRRSNIIDRLLTSHIRYTDFSKDSTGVFNFNLLRFFILYSNSILHHLDISSILLLRNSLSQHLPLYSLTTLFNSIC